MYVGFCISIEGKSPLNHTREGSDFVISTVNILWFSSLADGRCLVFFF